MRLEDSIVIDCPPDQLYTLVKDVERHVELLPGYRESRIVERKEESCIVQREAVMAGILRRWKSEVWLDEGKGLRFRQVEGPLKDMRVQWLLEPEDQGTRMSIIHDIHAKPRWKGWWFERWVAKPAIEKTARNVLTAIKKAAEAKNAS
jgi:ribosome-associated toxin RatA of RatAB toxin-antitoxin module